SSTTTATTTTNRILRRQQVPTRRNPVILSPLQLLPSRNAIQSESNSQPQNERLIESSSQRKQLDPIIPIHRTDNRRRKTFTQNTTTKTDGIAYNSLRESTIKALKSSIQNVNQKECSFLISQPIAKTIPAMELFELLKLAKSKAHSNSKADYHSKVSAKSREIFFELYNRIVIIIVPRYYPEKLNVFLKYLVQESVSNGLMVKALKNVSLLNSDQLIDFINYTEKACIWDKINNVDVNDYNRLTTILVHTALNIDPLFLNVFRSKMQSKWTTEMEMKVKYIYELSSLAPLLGGIYEHDNEDSLILNINELILSAMERFSPKLKETIHIFNVLISAVQVEEYRYGKASLMS
ncbi:MAG: hypothetical protein EBU93_07845, partial [Chlamydiae bacterium]|nr:hypothetical protein [Chlamydiota bacterium]